MNAHRQIQDNLRKRMFNARDPKGISAAALCEFVWYGYTQGNYAVGIGNSIFQLILSNLHHIVGWDDDVLKALENVLTNGRIKGLLNYSLEQIPRHLKRNLFYTELTNFRKVINPNPRVWRQVLMRFARRSPIPVYVDTEHCYENRTLPHGGKEALVTFCDVTTRTILLARTHRASCQDMAELQNCISRLASNRRFAVFDDEPVLHCVRRRVIDLQVGKISLKNSLKQLEVFILKKETVSDWTRPRLRDDQVQYAAMDALALHHLFNRRRMFFD